MISRSEGYRRSRGKEEPALKCVEDLFGSLGVPLTRITEQLENRRLGDLKSPAGLTVECKGQPIDPSRYPRNFVEVFEVTDSQKHSDGFSRLAVLLEMSEDELSRAPVDDRRRSAWPKHKVLDRPRAVSVSIQSIASSRLTVYANAAEGGKHIYVYDSDELMRLLRDAVHANGFTRGAGRSNVDTFAVFVPLPRMRWSRDRDTWTLDGGADAAEISSHLRAQLGA